MKSPLEQNYYELLEVPRDATLAEVDRAYDRARAYYGAGSVAVYTLVQPDELKRVQDRIDEAYLILADEKARQEYDARIGPPGPDERPLHKDVRLAREKDEAKKEEARKEKEAERLEAEKAAEKAAEQPPPAPPATEAKPPEPEVKREPTPAPMPAVAKEPTPAPMPAVARDTTPTPMAAVAKEPEPKPSEPPPASVANTARPPSQANKMASEGPLPPPSMDYPEPTPRAAAFAATVKKERPPEVSPKPAPKPEVPDDAVFTGDLLKRLREAAGITLHELADRTKIGRPHLDNIENDRFGALPAQVYLRGFLMSYARELRLDPLRVSKSYLEQVAAQKGKAGAKPRS
ncbi:MAG: helix-turn-helix domain-containing protein [Deltaproteobacteria bacterium]|nr:helix-turn-helix domain-containing protein [Deltaproteobacteria bacterium]